MKTVHWRKAKGAHFSWETCTTHFFRQIVVLWKKRWNIKKLKASTKHLCRSRKSIFFQDLTKLLVNDLKTFLRKKKKTVSTFSSWPKCFWSSHRTWRWKSEKFKFKLLILFSNIFELAFLEQQKSRTKDLGTTTFFFSFPHCTTSRHHQFRISGVGIVAFVLTTTPGGDKVEISTVIQRFFCISVEQMGICRLTFLRNFCLLAVPIVDLPWEHTNLGQTTFNGARG